MAIHLKLTTGALLLAVGLLPAQIPPPVTTFRVSVTARTAKAINYRHRGGATKIDFAGTDLLPAAHGEAKVESKQGYIEIEVEFRNLQPASVNGVEYLTYVLWAVTPEGRTANLGEVLLNGTSSKLDVTTELQVFGLIVTAEPYYAVTQPSDLVVMENMVRPDTKGKIEEIDAKYELLQRGQYEKLANPLALKADNRIPLELYEARNAVSIARSYGAGRDAADSFAKAEKSLAEAEAYQARNAGRKQVAMMAREAVQMAEDSRAITIKRQAEGVLTAERQQSADRERQAESGRDAAVTEAGRVARNAQADRDRMTRENEAQAAGSIAEADRVKRLADARAFAAKAESDSRLAAAGNDADRLKRENEERSAFAKAASDSRFAALQSESDARLAAAGTEADRLKRENDAQRASSQSALDEAGRQKAQLEKDKSELRAELLTQFNVILQTRDSARGLIVNMSDVLFDTGKYSLRPLAREKLAKVAGIVASHPGLRLDVEGHTDSVGADDYNQTLSEHRGESVRDYLTGQGMASGSVTTKGFGKTQPVASNETSEGRQQNRRVELVISGDIIGTTIAKVVAAR